MFKTVIFGRLVADTMNTLLKNRKLTPLPLGAIRPEGWLKQQLQVQLRGLSGALDQFWPDVMDSSWFGGQAEGWERAPYWLDGVIPLAHCSGTRI